MKTPCVIVLVGNIGSGKSTLVKKYVDKGYVCISRDALRYSIGAGEYVFNYKYEEAIHKTEKEMYRQFLSLGVNIIVDETGISRRMRSPYIDIYLRQSKHIYNIIAIEMPKLSMNESVDRRMKDPHGRFDRKLWESVWTRFNTIYESPSMIEGFDRVIRLKRK